MSPWAGRWSVGLLAAAALLSGCSGAPDDAASLPPTDACGAVERPTVQDGGHLIGDQEPPVPYSSIPASSGWHAAGAPPTGVHDAPLTDPQIVSVLHVGGIVAAYDPDEITEDDVAVLEDLARGPEPLTIAPYEGDPGAPLALVAWGVIQRCETVEREAVQGFLDAYADPLDPH